MFNTFTNTLKSVKGLVEYRSGKPKIVKNGSKVSISGLNAAAVVSYLTKTVDTTRLSSNMFSITQYGITFEEFFIPDVFLLLNKAGVNKKVPLSYRKQLLDYARLLKENTFLKTTEDSRPDRLNLSLLDDFNLEPMEYQQGFLNYYSKEVSKLDLKGILLSAAPGTGKTFTSLAWAHCLEATRVIVVCPLNSVMTPWKEAFDGDEKRNIKSYFKKPQSYWLSTSNVVPSNERFMICHYQKLGYLIETALRLKQTKKLVIILDESHNMNEAKSQQSQNFVQLCKETECSDVLFMSGTPIKALGSELDTLFSVVDKRYNETASMQFKKIYTAASKGALTILADRYSKMSYIVEKSELKLDKPNNVALKIKLKNGDRYTLTNIKKVMTEFIEERTKYYKSREKEDHEFYRSCVDRYKKTVLKDMVKYRELEIYNSYIEKIKDSSGFELRSMSTELSYCNGFEKNKISPMLDKEDRARFKDVKTLYKYPLLKIQGEALGKILGKMREECFTDIANAIDYVTIVKASEKKVLIFSSYVNTCQATYDKLVGLNFTPLKVYGDSTKDLSKTVNIYNSVPEMNPLVTTFESLSTAVPLTIANTIIMINVPFRDYKYQQAIARVWRKGADTPTYIYECELDTDGEINISTRSLDILKITAEIAESITGMSSGLGKKTEYDETSLNIGMEGLHIDMFKDYDIDKKILMW